MRERRNEVLMQYDVMNKEFSVDKADTLYTLQIKPQTEIDSRRKRGWYKSRSVDKRIYPINRMIFANWTSHQKHI